MADNTDSDVGVKNVDQLIERNNVVDQRLSVCQCYMSRNIMKP